MKSKLSILLATAALGLIFAESLSAQKLSTGAILRTKGIWSSAAELARLPKSGPAWEAVLKGAAQDCSNPDPANQNDNTNVYVLAAGIVYARTGEARYREKVVAACEKLVSAGQPPGRTLAWAREAGAYALAADLVGYRTTAFEQWLRNVAEVYVADDQRTLLGMFKTRPNNWGAQGFGALCAIYSFLRDTTRLHEIRNYWIKGVIGPNPGYVYGRDSSWHFDSNNPFLINPKSAIKQGFNIDGIISDDMRRGGALQIPPVHTEYPWSFMQGHVMAARILERAGLPIWTIGDSALYRAACALQIRLESEFGGWAAANDDAWMLPFLDKAYGTTWSGKQTRLWEHGKNAGWGYVAMTGYLMAPVSSEDLNVGPGSWQFFQNYPNPLKDATHITYTLGNLERVTLALYDAKGRCIATLVNAIQRAGTYSYVWESRDASGSPFPSGIYFCRLRAGAQTKTIKLVLMQ